MMGLIGRSGSVVRDPGSAIDSVVRVPDPADTESLSGALAWTRIPDPGSRVPKLMTTPVSIRFPSGTSTRAPDTGRGTRRQRRT